MSLFSSPSGQRGDAAGCADNQEDDDSRGEAHRSLQAGRGEVLVTSGKLLCPVRVSAVGGTLSLCER